MKIIIEPCPGLPTEAWDIRLPGRRLDAHLSLDPQMGLSYFLDIFDSQYKTPKLVRDTVAIDKYVGHPDWNEVFYELASTPAPKRRKRKKSCQNT